MKLYHLALALAALTGAGAPAVSAAADVYPSKPLQIVVSAAPGGSPDILARIVGQALSQRLGQPVSIDNKPA